MEILFLSALILAAFIAPLFVWGGLIFSGSWGRKANAGTIFSLMILALGIAGLLGQIFSARDLSDAQENIRPGFLGLQNISIFIWVNRIATIAIVLASLGVILQHLFNSRQRISLALNMWSAYAFSIVLGLVVSSIFGTEPQFIHSAFYAPIVLTAIFLLKELRTERVISSAKTVLLIYVYGSLVLLAIDPEWAALWAYKDGLVPGFRIRLFGASPHPNTLAMLALTYLVLEIFQPNKRRWRIVNILAAVAVLVLAQSKTAWLATLVWIVITLISIGRSHSPPLGKDRHHWESRSILLTLGFIGVFSGVLLIILAAPSVLDALLARINLGNERGSLATLTGRTLLWEITLDQWKSNPWFGYGPSLWDLDFRIKYGYLGAGQAHNQFVQTLGESGLFGLLGLTAYLVVLAKTALKHHAATQGLSTSLLVVILIRCATESPFRNLALLDASFLLHLILFAIFISLEHPQQARVVPPACNPR